MGKRQVRVVRVRKPVTFFLLLLVTGLMVSLLYFLSGRAYVSADAHPVRDLLQAVFGLRRGMSRGAVLAYLMPVIANMLMFVPWGFLAFVAFDSRRRPRRISYLLTVAGAALFAAAMVIWQQQLPTQVTTPADVVANCAGAFAGAALGQARKDVRVRFDF